MTAKELRQIYADKFRNKYTLKRFDEYRYKQLNNIMYLRRAGHADNDSYNDCIIMFDTETSKSRVSNEPVENYVVAFSISIRAYDTNIVTLYGNTPTELVKTMTRIHRSMKGDKTIFYCHNLAYDYVFVRKFMFERWGTPVKMLATKPHYPICIEFNNGIILKDSLILSQRSLEKWANDMDVEHKKAVGSWDYNMIRTQNHKFTPDELHYIENDTLAGVECINALMNTLNKRIYAMPYTATGIPREEVRKRGKKNRAKETFSRVVPKDYNQQIKLEAVYHGGYTHANRHYVNQTIEDDILALDFTSSYPYVMLSERYPATEFKPFRNCSIDEILKSADKYAFMFKLILINPRLKDDSVPMPALQYSKCVKDINSCIDNGRILCANYIEIYLNEIDLAVIQEQYTYTGGACVEVEYSVKEYLPRWFTDYVYECFTAKTMLKGGNPVDYSIAKAKVNSLYGMCVQKPCKDNIQENYLTGEYTIDKVDFKEAYEKYLNNRNSILLYSTGVWVTSYAMRNLFTLGKCCGLWLYSDTDSCYGKEWDMKAVEAYNEGCKAKLLANGYGAVIRDGKEYWLGVVDDEKHDKFRTLGAKRYCVVDDEQIKITVAGVPKKTGAKCLTDIDEFTDGLIFSGKITGKQTHTYFFTDDIHEIKGNEVGDSIDLTPCDYLLSSIERMDWESIFTEEVEVQVYE